MENKEFELSGEIVRLSKDQLAISMKHISIALNRLTLQCIPNLNGVGTDADHFFYDPRTILVAYKKEKASVTRTYLHSVLHCLLMHPFRAKGKEAGLWSICADIAVENIALELGLKQLSTERDTKQASLLESFKENVGIVTAEKLYSFFESSQIQSAQLSDIADLFFADHHSLWIQEQEKSINQIPGMSEHKSSDELKKEWESILRLERSQLNAQTESIPRALALLLQDTTIEQHEKRSYREFLQRFIVTDEEIKIDPEEFDYGLYSYGLKLYDNMPLVEPLEYKESEKIKEFVIAIDTSGSCQGALVQDFLRKTYDIMKSTENFFRKINMYILQADDRIRSSFHITCDEDFDRYVATEKLSGFGETDFRPVFQHVDELLAEGKLHNLKGLIYFTDGFGVFPQEAPAYESVFVFIKGYNNSKDMPAWIIKAEFN